MKTKFQHLLEKLKESNEYENFKQKNPKAFLCAGFFLLDFETKKREKDQIDYYLPDTKKIATFSLGEKIKMKISDIMKKDSIPKEIKKEVKTEIEALWQLIDDELKNHNVSEKIKKIVAILQNTEGKNVWYITCLLQGLEILKMHINDSDSTTLKFEKVNLIDLSSKNPEKPDYV